MDIFKKYVAELGLTEEEYWNEYRPKELTRYITHLKVQYYLSQNPNFEDFFKVDYMITNEDIRARLNN